MTGSLALPVQQKNGSLYNSLQKLPYGYGILVSKQELRSLDDPAGAFCQIILAIGVHRKFPKVFTFSSLGAFPKILVHFLFFVEFTFISLSSL